MTPDLPAVEVAIVEMTNAFRRDQKLSALRRDKVLDAVARSYANYLAKSGKFSHTADGRHVGDRAKASGYTYCWVGENLALNADSRGFATQRLARAAVEGWKNSPGHRKNMLTPQATEIGVGVARAPRSQRYLSVQVFGRPEAMRFSFKVQNRTPEELTYVYADKRQDLPPRSIITHTVCQSGLLDFTNLRRKERKRKQTFKYRTQPGDTFVVRPGRGQRVRIEHRPRVN